MGTEEIPAQESGHSQHCRVQSLRHAPRTLVSAGSHNGVQNTSIGLGALHAVPIAPTEPIRPIASDRFAHQPLRDPSASFPSFAGTYAEDIPESSSRGSDHRQRSEGTSQLCNVVSCALLQLHSFPQLI